MSNYDVWTRDNAIYQFAMDNAKARAARQWANWANDPNSVNLWIHPFNTQNSNWFDPWFENELGGMYNGPATSSSPDAYEVTQNAYFIYCWMRNKGYNDYCIQEFLTIIHNECNMGMGCWEGMLCPWNFANTTNPYSLIGFLPTRTGESGTNYDNNWYLRQSIIQQSVASAFDEVTHITYHKNREAGSWSAYQRWDLQTYTDEETGLERVTLVNGEPVFYITPGTQYCVIGYGMVQWTNWTRLVSHANQCFPGYGNMHWQFNASLQLMVLEWERSVAMNTPTSGQSLPTYDGEWRNTGARSANFVYNGTIYNYPYNCTWDNWASGGHLSWVEEKCAQLGITSQSQIETFKHLITIDIFCRCYLHAGSAYHDSYSRLQTQRLYFGSAIAYWNTHGGGDIRDVPRPRDIPLTELDKYHLTQAEMVSIFMTPTNRRKRKNVTLLL